RVHRRDAAGHGGEHALQQLDQAEVGDLDVVVDQEQVLRLDVQVLQLVLRAHHVERFGGVEHVAEQLFAGDAGQALGAALAEAVPQGAVGQLGDDHQLTVYDLEQLDGKDEGVADVDDALEGFEFLGGARTLVVRGVEVAVDEFDRLEQAARRFRLPDFAEAAAAQALDEPIA